MTTAADKRRDSIERALIHHGVEYSPPEPPGGRTTWVVRRVRTTNQVMTNRDVMFYVYGLADKECQLATVDQ
jgi:hypothetical protein